MIATSTKIRKTEWSGLTRAQVVALLRRLGVPAWDARITLRLIENASARRMTTNTQRPKDGSREFYVRVTDLGAGVYGAALVWMTQDDGELALAPALAMSIRATASPRPGAPRFWAVCFEYASGPYASAQAARRDIAAFDCPGDHEVVESDTKPVTRWELACQDVGATDE